MSINDNSNYNSNNNTNDSPDSMLLCISIIEEIDPEEENFSNAVTSLHALRNPEVHCDLHNTTGNDKYSCD